LHRIPAGEGPVSARSLPVPGEPGRRQVIIPDPAGAQVLVVRDKRGTTDVIDIAVPLDHVDVSPDGRYGIAYHAKDARTSSGLFAFPNTIALLDLDPAAEPRATTVRLGSGGVRPLAAAFSDELRLRRSGVGPGGAGDEIAEVTVALVFAHGGLVPVDLERQVTGPYVPISADADRSVIPAEVLFTNNRGDEIAGQVDGVERAFVLTSDEELFVFAISLAGDSDPPLSLALENVVTPDASISDIELFFEENGDEAGRSVVLAAAGDELILVDGYSGVAQRFDSPITVDRLVRFVDPETGEALCLGFSERAPNDELLRLAPLQLARRRATGVETLLLGSSVRDVEVGEDGVRAVLRYSDARDLGVLDLRHDGEILDVSFASAPTATALVGGGQRMLLVSSSPEDGAPHLAEVTLGDDFRSRDVRLDEEGRAVGQVGDYLWVDSPAAGRTVTFFPIDDLSREAAITFRGVFHARMLEETPPGLERGDER
jgi:hypothetical protein